MISPLRVHVAPSPLEETLAMHMPLGERARPTKIVGLPHRVCTLVHETIHLLRHEEEGGSLAPPMRLSLGQRGMKRPQGGRRANRQRRTGRVDVDGVTRILVSIACSVGLRTQGAGV